jgi:nucleotide-binding universal stress UspA family protein
VSLSYRRVSVAVDALWRAEELVRQAVAWARLTDAQLEICLFPWLSSSPSSLLRAPDHVLRARLGDLVERLRGSTEGVGLSIDRSSNAAAIVARAGRGADLVVLPHPATGQSRHQLALNRALSEKATLLLARASPATNRVIAASDLSDPSFPALDAAWDVAKRRDWELTTLHCLEPRVETAVFAPVTSFDFGAAMFPLGGDGDRTALARAHRALGISERARSILAKPPAAPAIVEVAGRLNAELVVIGRHRRPKWHRWIAAGTSMSVIARTPCSVLVVPLASESWRRVP